MPLLLDEADLLSAHMLLLPGRSLRRQKRAERLRSKYAEHQMEKQRRRELVKVHYVQLPHKKAFMRQSQAFRKALAHFSFL